MFSRIELWLALLLAVAVGIAVFAGVRSPRPTPENELPSTFLAGPGGSKALYDVLVSGKLKWYSHTAKDGTSKILKKCTLPLTGKNVVDLIITDLAVMEVTPQGLKLRESAPGVTVEEILNATEAELLVEDVCEMPA